MRLVYNIMMIMNNKEEKDRKAYEPEVYDAKSLTECNNNAEEKNSHVDITYKIAKVRATNNYITMSLNKIEKHIKSGDGHGYEILGDKRVPYFDFEKEIPVADDNIGAADAVLLDKYGKL